MFHNQKGSENMARKTCSKCGRQMEDLNFYTYKNGQKTPLCKSCLTMHIDNFNPETFVYILKDMDVPYVPEEWNNIRDKAYAKDPRKMNGMSVLGKYLSKMKLKQWKQYSWADTQALQEKRKLDNAVKAQEQQAEAKRLRQQYERGEISQAQYRTLVSTQYQKEHQYAIPLPTDAVGENNFFNEKNYISEDQLPDLGAQLSLEEKQYLAMKWGRNYQISEWIQLEKNYTQMTNSFDIQDADTKNTLILLCKTILKQNQALDMGDYEGYKKLSSVADSLRRSANFTAAQNKKEKTDFIDSVGQLVAYCQKNGGKIPRYQIKTSYDIVDKVIDDLKTYNKSLIYEDAALAREIESYIKEARAAIARRQDREQAKARGLQNPQISDEDILDFKDFIKKEKEETRKQIQEGEEDEFIESD